VRSLLCLLLGLLLASAPRRADDAVPKTRYVMLDGTRLLATPAAFGKTLAKLAKGTAVQCFPAKPGYLKVAVTVDGTPKMGFIPARSLQDQRPKLYAGARSSTDASAHEMAAATKGFNKQIEDDLRAKDTAGGYKRLDEALARTTVNDPLAEGAPFRKAGSLGEFKGGAQ
jgi:hypothetical protein